MAEGIYFLGSTIYEDGVDAGIYISEHLDGPECVKLSDTSWEVYLPAVQIAEAYNHYNRLMGEDPTEEQLAQSLVLVSRGLLNREMKARDSA